MIKLGNIKETGKVSFVTENGDFLSADVAEENQQLQTESNMMLYLCFMNGDTLVGIIVVFSLGTVDGMHLGLN